MPASRQMVLAMIVKQYGNTQDWVVVPSNLVGKTHAICRDGFLVEGNDPACFRPSQLGILSAGDLDA